MNAMSGQAENEGGSPGSVSLWHICQDGCQLQFAAPEDLAARTVEIRLDETRVLAGLVKWSVNQYSGMEFLTQLDEEQLVELRENSGRSVEFRILH